MNALTRCSAPLAHTKTFTLSLVEKVLHCLCRSVHVDPESAPLLLHLKKSDLFCLGRGQLATLDLKCGEQSAEERFPAIVYAKPLGRERGSRVCRCQVLEVMPESPVEC